MEKQKPNQEQNKLGGNPLDDSTSGGVAILACGQHREKLPIVGKTVQQIMTEYADQFEIHGNATPIINGTEVDKNVKVGPGEVLMFIHKAGEKG